ncbi:MAG: biopolymer transporter ExbD [Bacteroidaceae bacterium]|nr:biopolymer transporter ExbD [Bacteroidaceae bacterium]
MFKRPKRSLPDLNTAALPDLIFTILFFFFLVTHMRSVDLKLQYQLPEGQQLTKMKKSNSVIHVYVDAEGRVQIENSLVSIPQINDVMKQYMGSMDSESGSSLQIAFKADRKARMGVVNQVKNELRKTSTLKINYNATQSSD